MRFAYISWKLKCPECLNNYAACITANGWQVYTLLQRVVLSKFGNIIPAHPRNLAQITACERVGRPKHHWAPDTLQKKIDNKTTLFSTHPNACPSSTVLLWPLKDLAQDKSLWKAITAAPTRLPKANPHTSATQLTEAKQGMSKTHPSTPNITRCLRLLSPFFFSLVPSFCGKGKFIRE